MEEVNEYREWEGDDIGMVEDTVNEW